MIFVGRYVEIKNLERLIKAFIEANDKCEWTLSLYGCGPLEGRLRTIDRHLEEKGVYLNPFLQPEELAEKYKRARFFCLPSLIDHWGLVVHEAALSGCALLLGNRVGAAKDLLGCEIKNTSISCDVKRFANGFTFDVYCLDAMVTAIKQAMLFSSQDYEEAQKVSLELAKRHTLEKFSSAIMEMAG